MEVLLRGHGDDGGATSVLVRCHGGNGGAAATQLRIGRTPMALRKFVNTAGPRRSWWCHCGLCHTSTAVAPRLRCDGGIIVTTVWTVVARLQYCSMAEFFSQNSSWWRIEQICQGVKCKVL